MQVSHMEIKYLIFSIDKFLIKPTLIWRKFTMKEKSKEFPWLPNQNDQSVKMHRCHPKWMPPLGSGQIWRQSTIWGEGAILGGGAGHTMVSSASLATDEVYTFGGWRGIYGTLISLRVWFGDQTSDMQGRARKCTVRSFNWDGINLALVLGLLAFMATPLDQFGSKWHGITFISQ